MSNHKSTQILASMPIRRLKKEKMVNIGGRPVIVPTPRQRMSARNRAESIKLALAFAAIYLVWGSTYLAIRYAVETIPPLVTAGIRHSIAGAIMLAWACARGYRPSASIGLQASSLAHYFF
jgi:hypothetical protein